MDPHIESWGTPEERDFKKGKKIDAATWATITVKDVSFRPLESSSLVE